MLACIVGVLMSCGQAATMHIAGPVAYAPQTTVAWNYYAQPIQFVAPVVIIRRA